MSERKRGWEGNLPATKSFMLTHAVNGKTRLENFSNYLRANGLEVRQPKEWELFRFVYFDGLGIIWCNARGKLKWNKEAEFAWLAFRQGLSAPFTYKAPRTKLLPETRLKLAEELIARDGPVCVVCGQNLDPGEATIEHLLDRNFGGTDHIANLTVAHKDCNNSLAGCKTLRAKIEEILRRRTLCS
jgi:hypothetical protein